MFTAKWLKAREMKSTFNGFLSEKKKEKKNSDERKTQKESAIGRNRGRWGKN